MKELCFYPYYDFSNNEPEFETGATVMTSGIMGLLEKDISFFNEIDQCFARFIHKDLGILGEDDGEGVIYEVIDGEEVMGAYHTSKGQIMIVTSYDRKGTIIFLPSER